MTRTTYDALTGSHHVSAAVYFDEDTRRYSDGEGRTLTEQEAWEKLGVTAMPSGWAVNKNGDLCFIETSGISLMTSCGARDLRISTATAKRLLASTLRAFQPRRGR